MNLIHKLQNFFSSQIDSIQKDRVLRIYGTCLSAIIILTSAHWVYSNSEQFLARDLEAICWPMFENCRQWHVLSSQGLKTFFYCLGFISFIPLLLFLRPDRTKAAYWSLFALNIMKYFVVFMDFRLRLNQHTMAFFVTAVFLFIPHKKITLKILIILFYFWAGILKLDKEWLSGSALYIKPWLFYGQGLIFACVYVVFLEIAMIWGLLWDRRWIAWLTLGQLFIFHIFSFKAVAFFYPLLCFLMLMIFPLTWIFDRESPRLISTIQQKRMPLTVLVVTALFSLFQIYPKLLPGNAAITGEGRFLTLNMFDSFTTCFSNAATKTKTGNIINQNLHFPMGIRIHCDPIVYLSRARNICYTNRFNQNFQDLDLVLKTKSSIEKEYQTVIDIKDFCSKGIRYSFFSSNDWILKN